MERARHVAAVMATLISIASCAAMSPASPTSLQPYVPTPETGSALPPVPTPIPGSVTILALTPSSGSTVKLRDCSHDGWEAICTEDVQVILAVVLERDLPRATIRIRFYDDALACVETWMNGVSLAAGVTQTLSSVKQAPRMYARYQFVYGDGGEGPRETVQPCDLPAKTNRLAIEIFGRDSRTPILVKEFNSVYTFAAPPASKPSSAAR